MCKRMKDYWRYGLWDRNKKKEEKHLQRFVTDSTLHDMVVNLLIILSF